MDSSTCSLNIGNQNVTQSLPQRKFYQWVLKWMNGVHSSSDANIEEHQELRNPTKPDVPTLAGFLQAIGFKLVSFEKHADALISKKDGNKESRSSVLTIAIECSTSNMRATLELGDIMCQCPNPDHVKDASFWSISGTGPTGSIDNITQKVEETGSNLLPRLSKEVTNVLRDVSYRLFETISCEPDHNRNTDTNFNISRPENTSYECKSICEPMKKEIGVMRSHTQPEMRLQTDSLSSKSLSEHQGRSTSSEASISRAASPTYRNKPLFQRQRTWDMDIETGSLDEEPRPSPPKITSSPAMIAELSNSLGQISLQGEIENSKNVSEYIIGAQKNLEKALKMLSVNKVSITKPSPHQDQDCASVKSAPANISPRVVVSPYKSTGLNVTRGAKPISKLSHSTYEQSSLTKPNTGGGLQTPKARRSMEPTISKFTSRRSIQIDQENSKLPNRRRSFGMTLSAAGSNLSITSRPLSIDTAPKPLGNIEFNTTKGHLVGESDLSNRIYNAGKKHASSESQYGGISPASKNINTPTMRSSSMIKPPTKISKAIPIKVKPTQTSKINTGIAKKTRTSLSKE